VRAKGEGEMSAEMCVSLSFEPAVADVAKREEVEMERVK
jgi:hypothetical protein